ncbi:hypothetical protein GCM10011318_09630 [Phaeocystidibacter marisrubri]|nr:hypothetical protein GCM10011318_09630 [Phaeocystidibacter marisrubri]
MEAYNKGDFHTSCVYLDSLSSNLKWYNNSFNVRVHRAIENNDTQAIRFFDYYSSHPEFETSEWVQPVKAYINIRQAAQTEANILAIEYYEWLEQKLKEGDINPYDGLYSIAIYDLLEKRQLLTPELRLHFIKKCSSIVPKSDVDPSVEKYAQLYINVAIHKADPHTVEDFQEVAFTPQDQRNLLFYLLMDEEVQALPTLGELLTEKAKTESVSMDESTYWRWMNLTVNPSQSSLDLYREAFAQEQDFLDTTGAYIQRYWEPVWNVPIVEEQTQKHTLNSTWVLIDFWGTWCAPCVDELPQYQRLQERLENGEIPQLHLVTFSYGSKDLDHFLQTNGYDFKVVEINYDQKHELGIHSFPSTYIVSPSGRMLQLPTLTDKVGAAEIWSQLFQ